jgi:molybdopterin converting factor small subunit
MITVHVLLFASYADAIGSPALDVQVPVNSRVADVLALVRSHPGTDRLPPAPLLAVNAEFARLDQTLTAGDEVAIIPPVAGG